MFAWCGTVLRVDLSCRQCLRQPLDTSLAKRFLGGRGFNSKTLLDEIAPNSDPLGPENLICLAPGVLSATPLGLSSRLHVSTLSAYSGVLGDGNAGGSLALVLKRAGYDQIVIGGRAAGPVYLLIEDAEVSIRDASELWGKTTWETTDVLRGRHGADIGVACIGPAGENLVRAASTIVDKYASAARGSGAVWGAKNLKAIVVAGSGQVRLADRKRFLALAGSDRRFLRNDPVQREVAAVYGSHYGMLNWFPGYRNFEKLLGPEAVPEALRPEAWKKYEVGRVGCRSCHVKCKNVYEIPTGRRRGERGEALEYECIYCLGTNCGIEDPVAILEMSNLADAYGIDQIAVGNTIALAKDLYNRGIIDRNDTGGLTLDWEGADAQIELLHRTVLREGFGNLIAEGLYSMAKLIGRGAMDYCYHVKGLSRGSYPPGLFALAHAVSSRGADHLRGRSWAAGDNSSEAVLDDLRPLLDADPVRAITLGERATAIADAIGRCKGAVNTWTCTVPLVWKASLWEGLAELLTAATGVPFTAETIKQTADRICAVERVFNIRQGITREHDALPQKLEVKHSPAGAAERQAHFAMIRDYYRAHGYDADQGIPQPETLQRLDLTEVIEKLTAGGPFRRWDGPVLWPLDAYPRGGTRF